MNKKLIATLTTSLLLGTFSSCNILEKQKPQVSLATETVFSNTAGARAALTGCYGGLTSINYYGLRYPIFADMLADNLAHSGTFPSFAEFFNRNLLPQNTEVTSMWTALYDAINRTNNFVVGAEALNSEDFKAEKAASIAEARGLRGFHYANLVRYWGGVPIVLTPTTSTSPSALNVTRATEAEVYKQALEDLTFAETNAPDPGAASAGKLNKLVASALKSRVHLYTKEWQLALDAANRVINSRRYSLVSSYRALYDAKNGAETIWELQFDTNNTNQFAFFFFPAAAGGRNEMRPATSLPGAYETGDTRRAASIGQTGGTLPVGAVTKYFRIATSNDNIHLIRYAEVLLNAAEAQNELGRTTEAVALVNQIRQRAGLAPSTAATQADVRLAIERERRVEFAFEGHRWFDIKRTDRLQGALNVNPADKVRFLPIPFRETINNPNMKQNEGY